MSAKRRRRTQARQIALSGEGPVLMVLETFRMGGHATHDEAEARHLFDRAKFEAWGRRDPIGCFEAWLLEDGPDLDPNGDGSSRREKNQAVLKAIEAEVTAAMDAAADEARAGRSTHLPDPSTVLDGVFAED